MKSRLLRQTAELINAAMRGLCPSPVMRRYERASTLPTSNRPVEDWGKLLGDTGPTLESHLRFLLWMIPTEERFPRSQKFLLGDRIQATALDVLERLIEATYTKRRGGPLADADLGIEKLGFLGRLAHDLRYLDHRRYEHAARSVDETGRLVGGWQKGASCPRKRVTSSTRSPRYRPCWRWPVPSSRRSATCQSSQRRSQNPNIEVPILSAVL